MSNYDMRQRVREIGKEIELIDDEQREALKRWDKERDRLKRERVALNATLRGEVLRVVSVRGRGGEMEDA